MSNLPAFKEFIDFLQKNKYSDETIYNYQRDLESFDNFLSKSNVIFQKVTKQVIDNYQFYLISTERKTVKNNKSLKPLSSFSINRMLSALRIYLKYLLDTGYKLPVSSDIIKLIQNRKRLPLDIKLEDQVKLIEAPTKFEKNDKVALRNRAMLELIFATGLRVSELLTLKREQIDKTDRLYIGNENKKGRLIYLTPRVQRHIENYLKVRGTTGSPYLFIPYRGRNIGIKENKISPNYLQERIKKYRELLGINIILSAHSLRNGFVNYLSDQETNPAAIQILLGHESLDTTTKYVHASDRYAERIHRKYHPLKE